MSLYEKIERDGLSADQTQLLFQNEVVRYRNMLAHQHTSIQADGDGNVAARLAQMLSIYEAANSDFASHGFSGYMDLEYVGSFDKRFASLNCEARENLLAMLSRFDDLPGNLLNETSDALQRAGIADDDERRHLARRIICDARATAARLYRDDNAQLILATASGLAVLLPQPNVVPAKVSSSTATATSGAQSSWTRAEGVAEARQNYLPTLTADQARFAAMTPLRAVEEYMRLKPRTVLSEQMHRSVTRVG